MALEDQSLDLSNVHLAVLELDQQWRNVSSFFDSTGPSQDFQNVEDHARYS